MIAFLLGLISGLLFGGIILAALTHEEWRRLNRVDAAVRDSFRIGGERAFLSWRTYAATLAPPRERKNRLNYYGDRRAHYDKGRTNV